MTKVLFKVLRIFLYPLYFLSFLARRDSRVWVFGGFKSAFSDNAKYLYIYADKQEGVDAYWVTRDRDLIGELSCRGIKALHPWTISGVMVCLRAGVYIYNSYPSDINFWTSGGARLVNLWHGIPLKRIEHDIGGGPLFGKYNYPKKLFYLILSPHLFKKPDIHISPSAVVTDIFKSAFRLEEYRVFEAGYPRNDVFFNSELSKYCFEFLQFEGEKKTFDRMSRYLRNIIYLPTFREGESKALAEIFDFERLSLFLKLTDTALHIKLHPNMDCKNDVDFENIFFMNSKMDVYPFLSGMDCLITDYSSVFFDYALLDKPMIFYAYDRDYYASSERGIYFDYESLVPGLVVSDFDEFMTALESMKDSSVNFDFCSRFWANAPGNASEVIFKKIESLFGRE